jgi:hypothetical protein
MGSEAIDPRILTSALVGGEHYAMKAYGGSEAVDPRIFTSALVGGEHYAMKAYGGVKL